jgi:hypothetical protein
VSGVYLADSPEHQFRPQDRLPDRCGFISDGMTCGYDREDHEALWPRAEPESRIEQAAPVDGLPPQEHDRTQSVAEASAEIGVTLNRLQREHGLTTTEMLQAVGSWQMTCLKYMLRAERHPDNPGEPADWD